MYLKEKLESGEFKLDESLKSEQTTMNNTVLYAVAN